MTMEIISRKDAINQGLNAYYTGEPCKNNHVAKRYVQSGTCSACISNRDPIPSNGHNSERQLISQQKLEIERDKIKLALERQRIAQERLALSQQKQRDKAERESRISQQKSTAEQRRETKADMRPVNLYSTLGDLPDLKTLVLMWAQQRAPGITLADVVVNKPPMGDVVYTFRCFPEDTIALRNFAEALYNDHSKSSEFFRLEGLRIAAETAREEEERLAAHINNPFWDTDPR